MDHLIIKSIKVIKPDALVLSADVQARADATVNQWMGKHATCSGTKQFCRDYKKAVGWRKVKVRFSEFDCRTGGLVIRMRDINDNRLW